VHRCDTGEVELPRAAASPDTAVGPTGGDGRTGSATRAPSGRRRALRVAFAGALAAGLVGACAGADEPRDAVEVPTLPTAAGTSTPGAAPPGAAPVANVADVLRAGDAAAAAAGGEVIRTSVDLMGYLVELRQSDGSFTTVALDIGFGVVFVEDAGDPRDDAAELAESVDLRRAVGLALDVAAREPIGAAGDGIVVGAELEPDGYDIDIQYPGGQVLEVRLDDAWQFTGTRIRGG
jgi:hypothetical protein